MRMVFGLVLIAGLALAGAAVWMVQGFVSSAQTDVARERAFRLQLGELVEVYVANKPLVYGVALTRDDVEKVLWPKKSLPEGVFLDEAALFPGDYAKPRFVIRQMEKFEPLMAVKVTNPGEDVGLTARLSRGKRAFTIKVDATTGVSGFVQPGDFVDIYWTGASAGANSEITQLIESTVKVIAIDQAANQGRSSEATVAQTVTVEATPEVVARLAQARATGRMALSLVGTGDETKVGAIEVDNSSLLGIKDKAIVQVEVEKVCSIKTRRGSEVVEMAIPCTN